MRSHGTGSCVEEIWLHSIAKVVVLGFDPFSPHPHEMITNVWQSVLYKMCPESTRKSQVLEQGVMNYRVSISFDPCGAFYRHAWTKMGDMNLHGPKYMNLNTAICLRVFIYAL